MCQHTRQIDDLGDPAAVFFAFQRRRSRRAFMPLSDAGREPSLRCFSGQYPEWQLPCP
jgi:hypothetical protein